MTSAPSACVVQALGWQPGTAAAPLKSLQLPEPNNGIRMTLFYYNQTHFPYDYSYVAECGAVGGRARATPHGRQTPCPARSPDLARRARPPPGAGLNFNWCMDERLANATCTPAATPTPVFPPALD